MTLAGLLSEASVFPISWAVCSSSLASHLAMSPAPTSVTGGAVCAAPGTAISTAAVHDSRIATVIEASSSSVDFFILLPLHNGGTRQPRLRLYNAPTLASGDESAMNSRRTSENTYSKLSEKSQRCSKSGPAGHRSARFGPGVPTKSILQAPLEPLFRQFQGEVHAGAKVRTG